MRVKSLTALLLDSSMIIALFAMSFIFPTTAGAINTPWLHVNGNWLNDSQGNKVVLRGVAILPPNQHSNKGGLTAVINRVTEPTMYCRVVRVPVVPAEWTGQNFLTQYLKPCVDALTAKGVYVIIDFHHISDYGSLDASIKGFWNIVAPAFKDYSNVLYEPLNEPIYPGGQSGWTTWKTTAQPWVDLIRAAAPKTPILVGTPTWCQDARFAVSDPFKGDNLIYVIHVYPQHTNWDLLFGTPSATIPIFLSEWGYQNAGSYGDVVKGTTSVYGAQMKSYLAAHPNVNWTSWIHDNSWYPVMIDNSYNLLGGENYQGVFMKDFLYEKRNDDLPGAGTGTVYRIAGNNKVSAQGKTGIILFGPWSAAGRGEWGVGITAKNGTVLNVSGRKYPVGNTSR